jgi:hypothetical protein
MNVLGRVAAAGVLTFLLLTSAEAGIQKKAVHFRQGTDQVEITGRIRGSETIDYEIPVRSGQSLSVSFKPGNRSAYFNILPPGSDEAVFIGSTSGNSFTARLSAEGTYTIRVYLMRNAARRKETSGYTLTVGIAEEKSAPRLSFDRTLELQGIRFRVSSEQSGSLATLRIIPSGLELDNAPLERKIEGAVSDAEVADLNADGSPEIYVYVTSAGSGSYGSLVAFSANRCKSLSEIYLPPLTDDKTISAGYMGHDEFAVLEGVLGRRFPVYRDENTNAKATGGIRQLQYKLVPGEAGWRLVLDRVLDF